MTATTFKQTVFILTCILLVTMNAGTVSAQDVSAAQSEPDAYVIGQGDGLEIVVWKEPELSRNVKVRMDGRISLPLVDDVMAAGKTPMELKEEIRKNLSKFIEGPEVTVIVQSQASKSYYMLGEIKSNGEYTLEKNLTLLQALAKVNGFSEWAEKDSLLLLRKTRDGGEKRIRINYDDIVSGKAPERNLELQPGDTLVVLD